MSKRYVLTLEDGSVSIMELGDAPAKVEDIIEQRKKAGQKIVSWRETTIDKIPSERSFRSCWTDANPTDTVDVCPVKAREVIRSKRNEALERLDRVVFSEQRKPKGDTSKVEAEAQRLRDLTKDPKFKSDSDVDLLEVLKKADEQL